MGRILVILVLFAASVFGQTAAGHEKFDKNQYADAVAAYEKVPQAERNASMTNRLGISYHMLNRLREAENAYKSAIRLDPKDSGAYNNLAALYYTQRRFSDAERQLRRGLEVEPENLSLRRNLRAAKFARENGRVARDIAATVTTEHPLLIDSRDGDMLQMSILMPKKDIETAATHEKRGDSFFVRKMYDDAIVEYRKSIAADRYNASVLNRLGLVYHQTQRLPEAERYYRDALKLNPLYLEAINNVGSVEFVRKRYERAIDNYNKALKIRPESPTVLLNVGACLFALQRYDEGFKAYQRALEIDPKAFDHTSSFGTLIQTTQRNEPMLNFYLAKVFAGNGDKDRAISYLFKAVEEGFKDIEKIKTEPAFSILIEDERFVKLMETIGAAAVPKGSAPKL